MPLSTITDRRIVIQPAEVHKVLFEGKEPRRAVTDLMVRLPKVEWDL